MASGTTSGICMQGEVTLNLLVSGLLVTLRAVGDVVHEVT